MKAKSSTSGPVATSIGSRVPNLRLKLPARGGRVIKERSFLSAAAAGRSLSAFRYAAPGLKTRLLYLS